MSPFSISLLWLFTFLTPLSLFGQIQREALVETAFQELPGVVQFLRSSYEFDQKLTPDERGQLAGIFQITTALSHYVTFGADMPGSERLPRVQFSKEAQKFQLHAGEPERSAMTTAILAEPIWFNQRYLNSSELDPSYLDVMQILFHELGHKLGPAKNQAAIDSLAAKFVEFIQPYYQKTLLSGRLKMEILSLPATFRRLQMIPSAAPQILIQENGFVVAHQLDLAGVSQKFSQFTESSQGSGNIMETSSVRIVGLSGNEIGARDLSFGAQLTLEVVSKVVMMDPNIQFGGASVAIGNSQIMIPQVRTYDLVESSTTNLSASTQIGRPRRGDFTQFLHIAVGSWKYRDLSGDHRVLSAQRNLEQVQLQISNPEKIQKIFLRIQSPDGELLIPGKEGVVGRFEFSLPGSLSSSSGQVRIAEVVLNGRGAIPLPEVFKISTKAEASTVKIGRLLVFDGVAWKNFESDRITKMPTAPMRFRIQVQSEEKISQIRLLWNKGSSLYWDKPEQVFGVHSQTEEEVISNLRQIDRNTYEFISEEVLHTSIPETTKPIVGAFDSQRRFLKELAVTSESLLSQRQVFGLHLKIYNAEFLQVGPLKAVISCGRVHR